MNTVRLTVLLATAALLGGCSTNVDMEKLSATIKSGLTEQTGITFATVTCPPTREAKVGDTFECTAATAGGAKAILTVTQANEQDHDWKLTKTEGLFNIASLQGSLEGELKARSGNDSKVDCGGGKFREAKAGDTMTCSVTTGEDKETLTVTVKDSQGNISWKLEDPPDPPSE